MTFRKAASIGALALSFIMFAPAVASADPITGYIVGTLLTLSGTAAAVATFVINSALYAAGSFALGKITGAVSGKNKAGLQERQASVTQLSLGEVPREFVFGVCVTGGSLDDAFNWGGQYGTDYVTRCITLADHAVDQLYEIIVDEQSYPYVGNGVQSGFGGTLTLDFFNASAAGASPPAYVIANSGGSWTADDRHVGQTHVWVTYKFDEKVWPQGHPTFKFNLRGMRLYDPRRDPAFGYTGPTPNTWEDRSGHLYDANAALVRYAFQRGIYAEGHQGDPDYLLVGRGLSADEAPPERIIASANVCAEAITEGGGGSNIRYKAGGVIRASDDYIAVEEMFAAAMAGVIVQREGGVEVEPGYAKAAVVTITDGDLVVGERVTFNAFLPDSDGGRINTVIPRYVSPEQGWKDHSGPVRRDPADIAEDGGPRELTLPLALVFEGDQADRCAEIARRKARLERRAEIVLPPEFSGLEEGDWIAWTSGRYHDGATVRYVIDSWSLDEQWRMRLSLREIASSVYGVPDPIEATAEVPPAPVPVDALTLPGAAAQAITLAGEASVIPAVRFTWDHPVDAAIRAIRGEVRILGDTEISPTRFEGDALAAGVGIATNGVAAGQVLQARLVPIGDPSRPVSPSAWFTVTTGELTAGDAATWGGMPASRLAQMQTQLRATLEQLLRLGNDRAAGQLAEARERLTSAQDMLARLMLLATIDPIAGTAIVRSEVLLEGEDETIAQTFVQVRAATAAVQAAVALEQLARIAGDDAEASARIAATAAAAAALAAADLSQRAYTNGQIASAVASLATTAAVAAAIAASALSLRSDVTAEIATAVAGLATSAAVAASIAASALSLQSYTNGQVASAVAGLATTAAVAAAISDSALTLRTYTDGQVASAVAGLATTAAVAAAVAASALTLQAYADLAVASGTAGLVTTGAFNSSISTAYLDLTFYADAAVASATAGLATSAAVAAAIAASALSLQSYTNGQIATATAGLATAAQLSTAIAAALIQSQLQVDAYAATAALTFAGLASFNGLVSTVGIQGTAVSGLQSRDNTAHLELIAAAGAGVPALIGLASAAGSSDIAFQASRIWWGPNTVFHAATGQLRTTYGSDSRRVIALGASFGPDSLWMWTGPASVAYGSETFDNATGAAESDTRKFWGGETLTGPFDSGVPGSSAITDLTTSWQTLAWVERPMVNGFIQLRVTGEASGDATPGEAGIREWTVDYRLVTTLPDGSDVEALGVVTVGGQHFGSVTFIAAGFESWDPAVSTRTGVRRIALQARQGVSPTTFASVRNIRLRGNYFA